MNKKRSVAMAFIPATITALSLLGCTSKTPARIEDRNNIVFTRHGTMEVIRVYPNDTIESISQQRNIPVEILAATNNLSYPYHLYNVRTIMIPKDRFHKVQKSETLKSIARQYNVDLMHLMDFNDMTHMSASKPLKIGTIIKIPATSKDLKQHVEDQSLATIYSPTKEYDVMELDEVQDSPQNQTNLHEPIGTEDIKHGEQDFTTHENNHQTQNEITSTEFENDLKATLSKPEDESPIAVDTGDNSFKASTPLNSTYFIWPLNGKISRDKKDGLTIFAPLNTVIRAAGNGKVIYAENDNGEYGNLIIIKHQDGYLSAYAHNNQILVKKGDEVKKGQTISKVGKSGKVSKPQLFFSMRKGKDIIDPEKDSMQ